MRTFAEINNWLDSQQIGTYKYKSRKAALIRSCDPFGLFASYPLPDGGAEHYFNGTLDHISTKEEEELIIKEVKNQIFY